MRLWFEHLRRRGLRRQGFKQSKADECVFYKGNMIFVVYVDDGILIGPDKGEIDNIIMSLKEDYDLTDEGNLNEYLGIKIEEQKDGSSQIKGVNYWDTYSLVVSWETIRSLLTLSILNGWNTRQIDFVLAFPQAKPKCDMYMEIPRGCNVEGSKRDYVLKLNKNLYGSKQALRLWFEHLRRGLR